MLGIALTVYGIVGLILRPYTAENLYKEIAAMNIVESSIMAIRNPATGFENRFL
ncbi:hypothetical protein BIFGAL_03359 [Bifidobacterium gallicum DSM 20093 = LMG 11596]|uniref:Uncharacterized protein n=1 Tax=Bifidobacterium gallicum DSM 20093 = LMG 11596 TaxID=561180 RepID=D1NU38_9BIFI|nr:hypothetical protein BIFGAL_03359 [Bifidobacterium gallicum DSM 20093 = LMG 11596]